MRKVEKRNEYNASTTVEAAFVMPVIIFAIFAILRLLFFMYAGIKLEADLDRAVTEVSDLAVVYGEEEAERVMSEILESYIKDYPYYGVYDKRINNDRGEIAADAALQTKVRFGGVQGLFTKGMNELNSSVSVRYWNSPKIKRIISVILQSTEE